MTCDMRWSDSTSRPFAALTTIAWPGISGAAARTTARRPCDGTATTTNAAPSSAASSDAVGVTPEGNGTSGKYCALPAAAVMARASAASRAHSDTCCPSRAK
jgi:hypothetical protein